MTESVMHFHHHHHHHHPHKHHMRDSGGSAAAATAADGTEAAGAAAAAVAPVGKGSSQCLLHPGGVGGKSRAAGGTGRAPGGVGRVGGGLGLASAPALAADVGTTGTSRNGRGEGSIHGTDNTNGYSGLQTTASVILSTGITQAEDEVRVCRDDGGGEVEAGGGGDERGGGGEGGRRGRVKQGQTYQQQQQQHPQNQIKPNLQPYRQQQIYLLQDQQEARLTDNSTQKEQQIQQALVNSSAGSFYANIAESPKTGTPFLPTKAPKNIRKYLSILLRSSSGVRQNQQDPKECGAARSEKINHPKMPSRSLGASQLFAMPTTNVTSVVHQASLPGMAAPKHHAGIYRRSFQIHPDSAPPTGNHHSSSTKHGGKTRVHLLFDPSAQHRSTSGGVAVMEKGGKRVLESRLLSGDVTAGTGKTENIERNDIAMASGGSGVDNRREKSPNSSDKKNISSNNTLLPPTFINNRPTTGTMTKKLQGRANMDSYSLYRRVSRAHLQIVDQTCSNNPTGMDEYSVGSTGNRCLRPGGRTVARSVVDDSPVDHNDPLEEENDINNNNTKPGSEHLQAPPGCRQANRHSTINNNSTTATHSSSGSAAVIITASTVPPVPPSPPPPAPATAQIPVGLSPEEAKQYIRILIRARLQNQNNCGTGGSAGGSNNYNTAATVDTAAAPTASSSFSSTVAASGTATTTATNSATTTPTAPYSSSDLIGSYNNDTNQFPPAAPDELHISSNGHGPHTGSAPLVDTDRSRYGRPPREGGERRPLSRKDSRRALAAPSREKTGLLPFDSPHDRQRAVFEQQQLDVNGGNGIAAVTSSNSLSQSKSNGYFKPLATRNSFLRNSVTSPTNNQGAHQSPEGTTARPQPVTGRESEDILVAMGTNWNPSNAFQRNGRPGSYSNSGGGGGNSSNGGYLSHQLSISQAPTTMGPKQLGKRNTVPHLSGGRLGSKDSEPRYPDPMSGAPASLHQRISEMSALESETVRWERTRRFQKKKPRSDT